MISSFCLASMPVDVTITGCVYNGIFFSETTDFGTHISKEKYKIQAVDSALNRVDLSDFKGKKISIRGKLLPGDRFIIEKENVHVLGVCADFSDK
jgi:hypothetical protein